MSNTIYIYALVQTGRSLNDIRWCGQTNNPKRRLSEHKALKKSDNNTHKQNWIKSINKDIGMIILEETNQELCDEREVWWTLHLKSLGMDLLNIKIGGKTSRGFKLSPETIAKIIKSTTGQKRTMKSRSLMSKAHIGTKLSQETKNKMSAAKKGKIPKNLKALQESNKNMTPKQLEHVYNMHKKRLGTRKVSKESSYDILEKYFIFHVNMTTLAKEYQVTRQIVRKIVKNQYFLP